MKNQNLIGFVFGRLTVVSKGIPGFSGKTRFNTWTCICACGQEKNIRTGDLNSGRVISCGCLNKEIAAIKAQKIGKENKILLPKIASAKSVFAKRYKMGSISFDDFFTLSQCNCFYCGRPPLNKANRYLNKKSYSLEEDFIYNGLDRIDSNKSYTIDNIVSCCKFCNWAKRSLSLHDFINQIEAIYIFRNNNWDGNFSNFLIPKIQSYNFHSTECNGDCLLPYHKRCCSKISALKIAWDTSYSNDGCSFEQFYYLSQMNCYYCGTAPLNKIKGNLSDERFPYNGLDRIDSSKNHTINNIVPCCKNCNWMKHTRSLTEFNNWITVIYNRLDIIRSKLN